MKFLSLFLLLCVSSMSYAQSSSESPKILILGDSLSAGYQMPIEQSWPSLLPEALEKKSLNAQIINASISGDTTDNALQRLAPLLDEHQPDYVLIELGANDGLRLVLSVHNRVDVLIELGANDGLRGFPTSRVTSTLTTIIEQIQEAGSQVILMQIRVPPNYGQRYSQAFFDLYPALAAEKEVPLIPFFLEQVIIKPEWMMNDGLHPKPEAQPFIAELMAQELVAVINKN